jgi:hypothetical protein
MAQQNQAKAQQTCLTCPPLDGATLQFLRSWYSGEHEKLLLRLPVKYL